MPPGAAHSSKSTELVDSKYGDICYAVISLYAIRTGTYLRPSTMEVVAFSNLVDSVVSHLRMEP